MSRGRLHPRRWRGAAALEFALLLVPLLVILTGVTEFGRAMYTYNTLAKSARDAARLLSTQTPTDPDYPALVASAVCTAVHGDPTCAGPSLAVGLTTAMVSYCDPATCPATHSAVATGTGVANFVTVTIGAASPYVFQSLAPFAPALFGVNDITFAPVSVTMRQVL